MLGQCLEVRQARRHFGYFKSRVSGGRLGAWQKAGSVRTFVFRNCSPLAPACLFATFHPVLQMWQPSGHCYVFCHKVLRNTLLPLIETEQLGVLLVVKVHDTEPAKKMYISFGDRSSPCITVKLHSFLHHLGSNAVPWPVRFGADPSGDVPRYPQWWTEELVISCLSCCGHRLTAAFLRTSQLSMPQPDFSCLQTSLCWF